jgi:DNA-binding NtrC family response regulator
MLGESDRASDSAVIINRLEALRVLAESLSREIDGLSKNMGDDADKSVDLASEVQQFEVSMIRSALVRTGGRQRRAAAILGIKPTTLHEKMKRYGMLNSESQTDADEVNDNELPLAG